MTQFQNPVALAGRILLALIFMTSGYGKITGFEATQGYMESVGVPGALLPLVILVEIVGGALVAIGWQTRLAALALAGFTLLSALLFHFDFGDQMQTVNFMKNLAIAGGFLLLVAFGPGGLSLDARSGRETSLASEQRA